MIEYSNGFLLDIRQDSRLVKHLEDGKTGPTDELIQWLKDHEIEVPEIHEIKGGVLGFLLLMPNPEHRTLFKLVWGGGLSNARNG